MRNTTRPSFSAAGGVSSRGSEGVCIRVEGRELMVEGSGFRVEVRGLKVEGWGL